MRQDHWTPASKEIRTPSRLLNAAFEFGSRNRMLDLGRTTSRRIQLEPPPEQGPSRTHEESLDGLFVGVWYSLVPYFSGVLVSEAVDDVDFNQHEGDHRQREPDEKLDTTTSVCTFLVRSNDEVHVTHLSPEDRSDFDVQTLQRGRQ